MPHEQRPLRDVVDLTDPRLNSTAPMAVEEVRARVRSGDASRVREIPGHFAVVTRDGERVFLARSLGLPLRYFVAKLVDGPCLIAAHRIDAIHRWLDERGLAGQFHPSYTRMAPAHYVTEVALIGCPDPAPKHLRFLGSGGGMLPPDLDVIGAAYVGALKAGIARRLAEIPQDEAIGVAFSGGADSGAVFLLAYATMLELGLSPARLKAFTLTFGGGGDLEQARTFLRRLGLEIFHEVVEADAASLDATAIVRLVEDYKPLDVEAAAMTEALARGVRARYPDWRQIFDGDGGDENLKDYPIEINEELTIRSVVANPMLYQEGWGVGALKHSLTYSGGLSRACTRTFAPLLLHGFSGFSPHSLPDVVETAGRIPFAELAAGSHQRLYALKGEILARGVRALTGFAMPVFPKRRFQHGALPIERLAERLGGREADYRRAFHEAYGA